MIRLMEKDDLEELVPFLLRCGEDMYKSKQEKYKIDEGSIASFLIRSFLHKDMIILVDVENNRLQGIMAVAFYRSYYNYSELHVNEQAWHADPDFCPIKKGKIMIRLLDAMEAILNSSTDIKSIEISTNPHNDMGKLLERKGYKIHNINYVRMVA